MPDPTFVSGSTSLTFKPGNIQARALTDAARQRKLVSTNGDVRVVEISTTDDRMIEIDVVQLPRTDLGVYAGYDSLRSFLLTTVNWAENTWTFTDSDGDSFTVRFWDGEFSLSEDKKDTYDGTLLLRVE